MAQNRNAPTNDAKSTSKHSGPRNKNKKYLLCVKYCPSCGCCFIECMCVFLCVKLFNYAIGTLMVSNAECGSMCKNMTVTEGCKLAKLQKLADSSFQRRIVAEHMLRSRVHRTRNKRNMLSKTTYSLTGRYTTHRKSYNRCSAQGL